MTGLHQNPQVCEYISSRYFKGFQLQATGSQITLFSSDGTIISLLAAAKFIDSGESESVSIDVAPLVSKRVALKKAVRDLHLHYDDEAHDLTEALNSIHAFSDVEVKSRIAAGYVMYDDMPVLFPRGTEVICQTSAADIGGTVDNCVEVSSMFGNAFSITLLVIAPTSKGPLLGKITHRVSAFDARVAIGKLGIRPITVEEKAKLAERGKTFSALSQRPTTANYSGVLTIPQWNRDQIMGAAGRVMVDAANLAQIDAETYHEMMGAFKIEDESSVTTSAREVEDHDLWRCYHRIPGFSMRLKRWGWLDLDAISPIVWRDDAFSQLVLEPKRKRSMLHLVKNYGNSFSDFIDGKSGGLIFLLAGPPGCGKTLSAEAVAETLHRPLYSVSVGELGTTAEMVESRLRSILDLAYQWNAVLLLDEADIFMEARNTLNIERNAIVSIFLRQLEYFSGVMFLTTNRVTTFDPAFFSRVSLAIAYPKLDGENRVTVWRKILDSAGVDHSAIDIAKLASFEVNGRNIKTTVRIAQTLAIGEDRAVTESDLIEVLGLSETFMRHVTKESLG